VERGCASETSFGRTKAKRDWTYYEIDEKCFEREGNKESLEFKLRGGSGFTTMKGKKKRTGKKFSLELRRKKRGGDVEGRHAKTNVFEKTFKD